LEFAGGMWVWPGGRIDPADYDPDAPNDVLRAARAAAAREANEEAGLVLDPDALVWFSHWTPPEISPKRFTTHFFVAAAPEAVITIDGGEIHDHAWFSPNEAMAKRNALEIELSPPTWITLEQLAPFATVDAAMANFDGCTPAYFATRIAVVDGGMVALYDGDAAYDNGEPDTPGGRHRLWMLPDGWRYERSAATG
jgi:8-oxo-dGTP pyrophosphatase MutT (NUDIX family)